MNNKASYVYSFLPTACIIILLCCSPSLANYQRYPITAGAFIILLTGLFANLICLILMMRLLHSNDLSSWAICSGLLLCTVLAILLHPAIFKMPNNFLSTWAAQKYNPFLSGLLFAYFGINIGALFIHKRK